MCFCGRLRLFALSASSSHFGGFFPGETRSKLENSQRACGAKLVPVSSWWTGAASVSSLYSCGLHWGQALRGRFHNERRTPGLEPGTSMVVFSTGVRS